MDKEISTHRRRMVFQLVAATVGLTAVWGGYKIYGFINGIRIYREKTKSEWVTVPPSFLTLVNNQKDVTKEGLKFFRINDEVMGGKSLSELSVNNKAGSLVFKGEINTNGGGFASCRTLGDDEPLGFTTDSINNALKVKAKGDGQCYKLTLHTADSWKMGTPSWSYDFVPSSSVENYTLPISDFIASKQGRPMKDTVIDPSHITGIGFSLSLYTADGKPNADFHDGPFQLEIESVIEEERK
mmetsp:Transcript_22534/g.24888  ORF Transcript_22534/g.24888 Transcript_22534/m.24888 type:complete len:241 (-) Transcript_22534:70-792(-)|eukprot:CAMPEP_0194147568 /NCGR_PEP_ID=MMETSP0152-20130528/25942_1 /TAXON_ID=1049557 /ORGANISM="Thalassiothrix antarctica, Strain L6-D1" /LENGTH=240 /DNA_ID=CAMNT_0038848477 /DNA_START=82 /DNA_END=804 /DNA_ORIENTATION=+